MSAEDLGSHTELTNYPQVSLEAQTGYPFSTVAPPKPSLTFSVTFSNVFQILKTRFGPMFVLGLCTQLVYAVVRNLLTSGSYSVVSQWTSVGSVSFPAVGGTGMWITSTATMAVTMFIMLPVTWWASLAMCVMAEGELSGRRLTIGQALRTSLTPLGSLVPFIVLFVVGGAVVGMGSLWLVVGFLSSHDSAAMLGFAVLIVFVTWVVGLVGLLWLSVKLLITFPAMVVEHVPTRRALSRSWRITQGSGWSIFAMLIVINIVSVIASYIVTLIASAIFSLSGSPVTTSGVTWWARLGVSLVLSAVISGIVMAVTSILSQVVYRDRVGYLPA